MKTETKPEAVTAKVPEPSKPAAKVSPNTSANNNKKESSILVPTDDKKGKDVESPATIGIISYPQINNYVDPNKSGTNKPAVTKPTVPETKPTQPPSQPQPKQPTT